MGTVGGEGGAVGGGVQAENNFEGKN